MLGLSRQGIEPRSPTREANALYQLKDRAALIEKYTCTYI